MEAIAKFGSAMASRPNATHEDIRDAFTVVLESLGYGQKNRFHETPLGGGRLDTRLTTDDYVTVAVVEYKSRRDLFNETQLINYARNLRIKHTVFVTTDKIVLFDREGDHLVEVQRCPDLLSPNAQFVQVLTETLRKPMFPLSAGHLADHCDSLIEQPISVRDNAREFLEKLSITESPFGFLADAAFRLIRERLPRNGFERKTFDLWRTYFSPTFKERGGERRFKAWRQHLRDLLGHAPTDEETEQYLFALETSYTVVSRLLLAQVSGEAGLSIKPLGWLATSVRQVERDQDLSELRGPGLQLYVIASVVRTPDGLFPRLTQIFPSIFEEDFFDWWTDALTAYSLPELRRMTDPATTEPAILFARSLLGVVLTVGAFSFRETGSDFLGDLYQSYFDAETRKALGEFYTPLPIVEHMLTRVGYTSAAPITGGQILVDPACGSGTFLIRAIARYFAAADRLGRPNWPDLVRNLCDGLAVCGLDINPFAVVIAQVNYALSLVPFYLLARSQERDFRIGSIPVFRSDTLRLPPNHIERFDDLTPIAVTLPVGEITLSFQAPTPGMLKALGAANIADASQLLRGIYRAAKNSVVRSRPLGECLREELGDFAETVQSNSAIATVIESLVGSMRRLSTELGDGRLLKWVGDELVVTTLKVGLQYDYILCNPPYVTAYRVPEEQWEEYEDLGYELVEGVGKRDLAYPFLEWAIRRVKDGSRLAFIMTDKWMEWGGREKIRDYVLDKSEIVEIVDSQWVEFFEKASNAVAIVVLSRGSNERTVLVPLVGLWSFPRDSGEFYANLDVGLTEIYRLLDSTKGMTSGDRPVSHTGSFAIANLLPRSVLAEFSPMGWSPLFRMDPEELELLSRLKRYPHKLAGCPDFLTSANRRVFEGAFFTGTAIFVLSEEKAAVFLEQNDPVVPAVDGTDVEPFGVLYKAIGTKDTFLQTDGDLNLGLVLGSNLARGKYLVFPYEPGRGGWQAIPPDRLSESLKNYLKQAARSVAESDTRARGSARYLVEQFESDNFQWIHRAGQQEHVTVALQLKGTWLVWRDVSRGNAICHFEDKILPLGTCYFAAATDAERGAYYQGVMGSSLLEFYHKGIGPAMPAGTVTPPRFRYKATYVESWPAVPFDLCEADTRDNLIRLVGGIREIASALYATALELRDIVDRPIESLRRALGSSIDFSTTETISIDLGSGVLSCPKPLSNREENLARKYVESRLGKMEQLRNRFIEVKREIDHTVLDVFKETASGAIVERFLTRIGR